MLNLFASKQIFLNRRVQKQNDGNRKQRKGRPSKQKVISNWDNRSPISTFENNAWILKQSLSRYPANTRVHLPDRLLERLAGQEQKSRLLSPDYWTAEIEYWLSLNSNDRKQQLDTKMKPIVIQKSDPRKKLHEQFGVTTAIDIPPFSIIAPYAGLYCTGHDLIRERARHGANTGRYSVDCSMNGLQIDLCGYAHGNITICINANTTYSDCDLTLNDNCCFVVVIYKNWPYVFITSTEFIPQNTELLIDYGKAYWK